RGLELESLPASAVWLAHALWGAPAALVYEANVQTLATPHAALIEGVGTALGLALLAAALWLQWRGRLTLGQASAIALLALLIGSKVFSPQYLLWVTPLLALEAAPLSATGLLWLLTAVLTALAFPAAYEGVFSGAGQPAWPAVAWFSVARNVALVACAAMALWWARHPLGARPRPQAVADAVVAAHAPAAPHM
ncbi:MAG TPA: hypothetical protein VGR57_13730, partial [Ktedonobacterales bacterium]|nr:hypothetical protein [Ktedonobacterales bacterium]